MKDDFYEKEELGICDLDDAGLQLQFSANGRNTGDYIFDRDNILFIYEEIRKWLKKHPVDSDDLTDEEIAGHIEDTLMSLRFGVGSSRAARILGKLAAKWDD